MIPIKNLPEYLKTLKDSNSVGDGVVVDMGQIISPRRNWFRAASYSTATILFLAIGGLLTYNNLNKDITVIVNTNNPEDVSDIVSENGGSLYFIEKNENNQYRLKILTKKSAKSFLNGLRKNKDLEKVELED